MPRGTKRYEARPVIVVESHFSDGLDRVIAQLADDPETAMVVERLGREMIKESIDYRDSGFSAVTEGRDLPDGRKVGVTLRFEGRWEVYIGFAGRIIRRLKEPCS